MHNIDDKHSTQSEFKPSTSKFVELQLDWMSPRVDQSLAETRSARGVRGHALWNFSKKIPEMVHSGKI